MIARALALSIYAAGMVVSLDCGGVLAQIQPSSGVLANVSARALRSLDDFKINPAGPMARNPHGGGALSAEIRDLLVADKGQLTGILALIPAATAAQQGSLGSGLGLARLLIIGDAEFASELQARVVGLDNRNVLTGFSLFGGGSVAALFGSAAPPAAALPALGPVGSIGSASASNSQGWGDAIRSSLQSWGDALAKY